MTATMKPHYGNSHAIVIGIDKYEHATPLGYAKSDAKAIKDLLCEQLGFSEENVCHLEDEQASRQNILDAYLDLTSPNIEPDDRIFFFYAGHGHTVSPPRREVGFLIPYDGDIERIGTLIRWDDFTRNAELINAKHILYVMDACYGGLAIARSTPPGAMRFLKDMLLRESRQVITAGKADELVADLGGPRPNHSIFTGHLLEALEGKAANADGLITANSVMSYVYRMVGSDGESNQTPHFGYLYGDGDFIIKLPDDYEAPTDEKKDVDQLVTVLSAIPPTPMKTNIDNAKELLADEQRRIALHDLLSQQTRTLLASTSETEFPLGDQWSEEEFADRIKRYELASNEMCELTALTCFWAQDYHASSIQLPIKRYSSTIKNSNGLKSWLNLRWYPVQLMLYSGGIGALAADNYLGLASLLSSNIPSWNNSKITSPLVSELPDNMRYLIDLFKTLPDHEQQYTPISEYLYKHLQPLLDDLLFLGEDYDQLFDKFEILYSLEYVHRTGSGWAPAGRYAWKFRRFPEALNNLREEANEAGDDWPPLKAGLCGGSIESFSAAAKMHFEEFLPKLQWF